MHSTKFPLEYTNSNILFIILKKKKQKKNTNSPYNIEPVYYKNANIQHIY